MPQELITCALGKCTGTTIHFDSKRVNNDVNKMAEGQCIFFKTLDYAIVSIVYAVRQCIFCKTLYYFIWEICSCWWLMGF